MTIRVGILGYGNLGEGVECAVKHGPDMELEVVFTRRNPNSLSILTEGAKVCRAEDVLSTKSQIDMMILREGNVMDLPGRTPEVAAHFSVIGSFDTHTNIPRHFEAVDGAAKRSSRVGIVFAGWDPGMFSLSRLYANAVLPGGSDYTLWGKGVSQGHSDAVRRIKDVKDARQYTIPVETALMAVRSKKAPELTTRDKHTRGCFVVVEEGADLKAIEEAIITTPSYFTDYDTTVHFISQEELIHDHIGIPHSGFAIRTGNTGWNDENGRVIEYSLKLDSNPEFTASAIATCARATYRLSREGQSSCKTVFDIASAYLSVADGVKPRKRLL